MHKTFIILDVPNLKLNERIVQPPPEEEDEVIEISTEDTQAKSVKNGLYSMFMNFDCSRGQKKAHEKDKGLVESDRR